MQVLDQREQFHNDTTDRDITISNILPKIIKGFVQAFPVTADDYYPIDIYAITKATIQAIPVQVKSRPTYHVDSFETTKIDTTAYDDLKNWGLLVILYPDDRKVLIYNHKELQEAFVGNIWTKNVKTWRESKKKWEYEDKYLTDLTISKGRIYDYEYFGI